MEAGNENAAYRLASITPNDLLLAISLPRYSQDTLQLARFALERGATVLAITDSPASPLASHANHTLFAAAGHPVLISSNSAVLALIEGLVAAVMTRTKEAVKLSAELTESVLSYLHVSGNAEPGVCAIPHVRSRPAESVMSLRVMGQWLTPSGQWVFWNVAPSKSARGRSFIST